MCSNMWSGGFFDHLGLRGKCLYRRHIKGLRSRYLPAGRGSDPLPNQARYQLRYTRIFNCCHDTTANGKNKVFSVCGHLCGQSRFCVVFGNRCKSSKHRCHKALRRFALLRLGYRHGTPKPGAIPTSLYPDIQFLPLYHGEEKNKDYSVRARFYGQSRFCSALGSQSKSRKHSHRKAFRRFVLPCSGYRHGALKRSALSIGLPLILRIRRPHPGGVFTISAFQMFCNRKISSPEPP